MTAPIKGACHCGAVRFEVTLIGGLEAAHRCTCSFCRMRGAVALTAPIDGFKITAGADHLTLYQFNTKTARHFFCKTCGIYTHHQRRSNPNEFGVNAACLEGVSPFDFDELPVYDGVNHPSDGGPDDGVAGILRYTPSS